MEEGEGRRVVEAREEVIAALDEEALVETRRQRVVADPSREVEDRLLARRLVELEQAEDDQGIICLRLEVDRCWLTRRLAEVAEAQGLADAAGHPPHQRVLAELAGEGVGQEVAAVGGTLPQPPDSDVAVLLAVRWRELRAVDQGGPEAVGIGVVGVCRAGREVLEAPLHELLALLAQCLAEAEQ